MRLLLSTLAWTLLQIACIGAVSAQEPGRVYKIGWLWSGSPYEAGLPMEEWRGPWIPFRETLREKGYVLGKNLVVDTRDARGNFEQLPAHAAALVAANVDVIVAPGTPSALAAMQATKSIPIVFPGVGDPVAKGIVASLARPGGNVTGIAVNIETGKSWQWLRELAPTIRRVGGVANARNAEGLGPERVEAYRAKLVAEYKSAAGAVGLEYVRIGLSDLSDVKGKLDEFAANGGDAIVVHTDAILSSSSWRASIMETALRHRLVSACWQWFGWAQEGCVLTYGEDPAAMRRSAALQVAKIFRGMKPADIPVEQPTTFKLILNVKAAKALGLTAPPSLLASADEVIE